MKLIYCIASIYNPGGMERVLLNKLNWLAAHGYDDLMVVTTDQAGRPPFYSFPPKVRMEDLAINYSSENGSFPVKKILAYLLKRRRHRSRLKKLLLREKADIVISLYPSESSFIPRIKDGSKKILELHYSKYFRLQYGRSGLLGLADRFRTGQDRRIASRFDRFVVLTREDAGHWGEMPNLVVIPNAARSFPGHTCNASAHRVIAVGRLDYQKGFDRLLKAWAGIPEAIRKDWKLDIFGQGEWENMLTSMVQELGLTDSARICPPTTQIFREYANSSILAMSSHYEGFPMVMIEGMACGLPVVSFDYQCGPRDIISEGINGLIVRDGDIKGLAATFSRLMQDDGLRSKMSKSAKHVIDMYSEESVMKQWEECFQKLLA